MARSAVEEWGAGRPFDNDREMRITRYFRKRSAPFGLGEEVLQKGDPSVSMTMWLRYAEFEIKERSNDI